MSGRRMAPDGWLFAITMLLIGFGLVMLYSASVFVAEATSRSPSWFLVRQTAWAVCGGAVLVTLLRFDYRRLNRPVVAWFLFGAVLVGLLWALFSEPLNNSQRWIRLGAWTLQPSEPAKLAVVVLLAHLLSERAADTVRGLLIPLAAAGLLVGLIFVQPDLGTATFVGLLAAALVFLGGARRLHLVALGAGFTALFAAAVLTAEYRVQRILSFLDPFADPLGQGFQLSQSLIALGSGGLTGVGFTASRQKLLYLPEPHSDFVFSVIGEELGWIGAGMVVVAFLFFALRGIQVSLRAPDRFGMLLGMGATLAIAIQALLNASVTTGLLPTTGIPLPFISAGGSSLVTSMAAAGLLLSVSQRAP